MLGWQSIRELLAPERFRRPERAQGMSNGIFCVILLTLFFDRTRSLSEWAPQSSALMTFCVGSRLSSGRRVRMACCIRAWLLRPTFAAGHTGDKLFFVKVDVKACFDTIKQEKLLQMLNQMVDRVSSQPRSRNAL